MARNLKRSVMSTVCDSIADACGYVTYLFTTSIVSRALFISQDLVNIGRVSSASLLRGSQDR